MADTLLKNLRVENFRNLETFRLENPAGITIIHGANATGKSSVLEAIQLCTALRSFRTSKSAECIRWGSDRAVVEASFADATRLLDIHLSIDGSGRRYSLNGKKKTIAELVGLFPVVVFTPDDLNLVKGSRGNRRKAIDMIGMQISKNYGAVKRDYDELIKSKNNLLAGEVDETLLDTIDELLARIGSQLMVYRRTIVEKLKPQLIDYHHRIAAENEDLSIRYEPGLHADIDEIPTERKVLEDIFIQSLRKIRAREIGRGKAIVGAQADDIRFLIDGHDAVSFASQGQQRSIVLSFKCAELSLMETSLEGKPLLLLDDVMSELDENRRNAFMEFISDDYQTFITTTNLDYFTESFLQRVAVMKMGV